LTPVVKSRICVASLRCSSFKYVEYFRSSRLGPLLNPFGALEGSWGKWAVDHRPAESLARASTTV